MQASFYIVIKSKPGRYTDELQFGGGRVVQKKPERLARDEISLKLNIEIPDSLFKRPTLTATFAVPEPDTEFEITPEVQQQVSDQLKQSLGINVDLEFNTEAGHEA